jgi:hypothetical protein
MEILLAGVGLLWLWVFGTVVVGFVAETKGRSPWGWARTSFLFVGPLLALIALAGLPGRAEDKD